VDLLSRANLSEENANYIKMINKASGNLLSTIEGIIDINSAHAHAKNLEMILKVEPDIPPKLMGDPDHLTRILANFLGNAVKFTKTGEIIFTISKASSTSTGAVVRVCIRDTGIGIPADKQSVIFESFTQLEQKDVAMKRQGVGLSGARY
jgi:signal transduction histidine kinase